MTSAVENFESLMDKKKDLESQIRDEGKNIFYAEAKHIFEKHGDIVDTFGWTQYTPYFNDGDPCEFTVHELFIWSKNDRESEDFEENYYESMGEFSSWGDGVNKLDRYLYDYQYEYQPYSYRNEDKKPVEIRERKGETHRPGPNTKVVGEVKSYENPNFDPNYGEAKEEIEKLRNLIDENTLLHLFGDHCVVLVTADGVSVEEHSHD